MSIDSFSVLSIDFLFYRKLFCSIDSFSVHSIAFLFYKYGKYIWISIKGWEYYPWKSVNRDKCSFTTKQRMFGVFAIDEILRYWWALLVSSRTLCHPGLLSYIDHSNNQNWMIQQTNLLMPMWWSVREIMTRGVPGLWWRRRSTIHVALRNKLVHQFCMLPI